MGRPKNKINKSKNKKRWSERILGPKPQPVSRPKTKKYTKEALTKAVEAFKNKEKSRRHLEEIYGVPCMTIQRHANAVWGAVGRSPFLKRETEKLIVDTLGTLAQWGFGLGQLQIRQILIWLGKKTFTSFAFLLILFMSYSHLTKVKLIFKIKGLKN